MTLAPLGRVFDDADVARAYRHRAPYPPETFAVLEGLLVEPRTVLDAGAGNGALARGMVRVAARVDAVDPSGPMIDEGRRSPGGADPRLRWIAATAEEAPLEPPYGLITAGASLHWMDPARVMPRFAAALAVGAVLAIVDQENEPTPWRDELVEIIERYSEIEHHQERPELIADLEAHGFFRRAGEARTAAAPVRRTVDACLEYLHSTSTLARVRLGDRTARFDDDMRALFARHSLVEIEERVSAIVVWGQPLAGPGS